MREAASEIPPRGSPFAYRGGRSVAETRFVRSQQAPSTRGALGQGGRGLGAPVWSRDPGGPLPTREIPWFSLGRRGRGGSEEEIYLKDGDFLLFLLSRSGRRRSLWPEAHGHAAAGPRSTPLFSCQERPWAGLRPPLSGRLWERLVMFVTAICLKYHTGNKKNLCSSEGVSLSGPSGGISFHSLQSL